MISGPTDAQRRVIRYIEDNLSIEFDGQTRGEAYLWIQKHMEASRDARSVLRRAQIREPLDELIELRDGTVLGPDGYKVPDGRYWPDMDEWQ
jgi:hypothetical protein